LTTVLLFLAPLVWRYGRGVVASIVKGLRKQSQPRKLDAAAQRAINLLFFSSLVYLILSFPSLSSGTSSNSLFQLTQSGLHTSIDVIASRLALIRSDTFNSRDEVLLSKLRSQLGRKLYLRFGGDTLLDCPFCTFEKTWSFYAYWMPTNVILPHLIHFLVLGLSTSHPFGGKEARRWRAVAVKGGMLVFLLDLFMVFTYEPDWRRAAVIPPASTHETFRVTRMLTFATYDAVVAGFIYLSGTNRLFGRQPSDSEKLGKYIFALSMGIYKIRAKLLGAYAARMSSNKSRTLNLHECRYWKDQIRKRRSIPYAYESVFEDDTGRSIYKEKEPASILAAINKGESDLNLKELEDDVEKLVSFVTRETHDW
ncbi:hypothetical protein KEM54_001059, partial [Ascosphaera aggregata]